MWLQCVHNPPPSCMPALPIDRLGESSGIPRAILASNLDRILVRGIYLNGKVVSITLESLATVATPAIEPRLMENDCRRFFDLRAHDNFIAKAGIGRIVKAW